MFIVSIATYRESIDKGKVRGERPRAENPATGKN